MKLGSCSFKNTFGNNETIKNFKSKLPPGGALGDDFLVAERVYKARFRYEVW